LRERLLGNHQAEYRFDGRINPFDSPGFAVLIREANEGGLKPRVYSGLILSGAFYPDLKIGVMRRERIKHNPDNSADMNLTMEP
jgi:hypothetical protein